MKAKVTRIHPEHVKDFTPPAAMEVIDKADSAYVLTMTSGKWAFKSAKGTMTHLELVGLLRCVSLQLERQINA